MHILHLQEQMTYGKDVRIWFSDGSYCIARNFEDLVAVQNVADKIEVSSFSDDLLHIAIIDADLIGIGNHRFPNLVSEKISAYWKDRGAFVELRLDYNHLGLYDHVYVSKVFTDTKVPDWLHETDKIHLGGTGFFFDKAPNLPYEIEHHMPDYHLYDGWIHLETEVARKSCERCGKTFDRKKFLKSFSMYLDYSIGFLTSGCFRKCGFCVNQKYDHVFPHSPLSEFYDPSRKKICFLDDNFLGYGNGWKPLLEEVIATGKKFTFKQGVDERLLTDERCKLLFSGNYDSAVTFAFDRIADYDIIEQKLQMIRKYTKSNDIMFYVLVGFESTDAKDIENAFKRIELLSRYKVFPYIMRYTGKDYAPWERSEYRGMYIVLARWCNQISLFKRLSIRQFAEKQQLYSQSDSLCAPMRYLKDFELKHPDIAEKYFDMCWNNF